MHPIFSRSITAVKGVGASRAELFKKLGVTTLGALLRFYPRDYDDWSSPTCVFDAPHDEPAFIAARVISPPEENFIRKSMTLYNLYAADENGVRIKLTFFNNPYIKTLLKVGGDYIFHGKLSFYRDSAEMTSPAFQKADAGQRIIPKYPQTEKLASRVIEQTIRNALDMLPDPLPDPLPDDIRQSEGLCGYREALRMIHQPGSFDDIAVARKRLIFEELLMLQLGLMRIKSRSRSDNITRPDIGCIDGFYSLLPFEPTGAQRRAISDAARDMAHGEHPMARLIQGDVGSGKTVVAAALCYICAKSSIQSALMAPTEILARQHYNTLRSMLEPAGIKVSLLIGALTAAQKRAVRESLESGETDIIVGTHALISDNVQFASLGLVITDEQHRFGVAQRAALSAKGRDPHLLVMSATPIPRTLALMIFGDLDVSVLDEMPRGRIPVETLWIDSSKRERAYGFIKKHLDEGRQAFIVCPLVDDFDGDLASAEQYALSLSAHEFRGYRVGLLHGKMKNADKDYTMQRFLDGDIDILVSTTVVEVGVDVPNAVIMLIENAERFGLSQLHQLRGRVGRGSHKSYCILISDDRSDTASARMGTMMRTSDGFEISNEDLRLRGPGDFFGSRQHGLPNLRLADLGKDMTIFASAQSCAQYITARDGDLSLPEHRLLRDAVDEMFADAVLN